MATVSKVRGTPLGQPECGLLPSVLLQLLVWILQHGCTSATNFIVVYNENNKFYHFCFHIHLTFTGSKSTTHTCTWTDVHPHTATHSQTDRQTDREVDNQRLTTDTHREKGHTPTFTALFTHDQCSAAPVNPIIPHIPASQPYFMRFIATIVA